MNKNNFKKIRNITIALGGISIVAILFTNATQSHMPLSADDKQRIDALVASVDAQVEAKLALDSQDPAEQNRHADRAQEIANKIRAYKNSLSANGKLRERPTPRYSCQVISSNCDGRATTTTATEIKTQDQKECMGQAVAWQNKCKGTSTATFYLNGEPKSEAVSGSSCVIRIKNCQGDSGLVGSFTDTDPDANADEKSCLDRQDYYKDKCRTRSDRDVAVRFYRNGMKVSDSRRD